MTWVDSHCHLNFPDFSGDLTSVLARARAAGVQQCLTICTQQKDMDAVHGLAEDHALFCSVGVHPEAASDEEIAPWLVQWAQKPRVVALGETGLDATYPNGLDVQRRSLREHIEVANSTNLPLIVHSRGAEEELVTALRATKTASPGVIHCFTGSETFARAVLDLGFYLSLSGILTFKNAEALREVVKIVPLERLLVETDAPYLAPVPHRGQRNEPAFVVETGEYLAKLLGVSSEIVARTTTENFYTLFSKIPHPLKGRTSCASQF